MKKIVSDWRTHFWSTLNKDGPLPDQQKEYYKGLEKCWVWVFGVTGNGYGGLIFEGKRTTAHRVAWILAHGNIPEGLCVLHKCDNPLCCNPDHLFLGTRTDNSIDKESKGRGNHINTPKGEKHGMSRLSESDILRIRELRRSGLQYKQIASLEGIGWSHVKKIARRDVWRHVA